MEEGDRAHSAMLALPRTSAPLPLSRARAAASAATTFPASATDPAVVGRPATSMLSLTRRGTQKRGGRRADGADDAVPFFFLLFAARAAASTESASAADARMVAAAGRSDTAFSPVPASKASMRRR